METINNVMYFVSHLLKGAIDLFNRLPKMMIYLLIGILAIKMIPGLFMRLGFSGSDRARRKAYIREESKLKNGIDGFSEFLYLTDIYTSGSFITTKVIKSKYFLITPIAVGIISALGGAVLERVLSKVVFLHLPLEILIEIGFLIIKWSILTTIFFFSALLINFWTGALLVVTLPVFYSNFFIKIGRFINHVNLLDYMTGFVGTIYRIIIFILLVMAFLNVVVKLIALVRYVIVYIALSIDSIFNWRDYV